MNTWWGPRINVPVCDDLEDGPDPEGAHCLSCEQPCDAMYDRGVWTTMVTMEGAELVPQHWECSLRAAVGSVGHQRGQCSCFQKTDSWEDPPHMTKREAALAASLEFYLTRED